MKSVFSILLSGMSVLPLLSFCPTGPMRGSDACHDRGNTIRIATFNIRSNFGSDTQDWATRLGSLDSLFGTYDFDILGIQEPYQRQIDDLMRLYGHVYNYFVVNTGNITAGGVSHSNPVFYRKDRFNLLDSGVFWFSEMPDSIGSVSWDASQARNCVWVRLYDRKKGITFYVFNSHFDHKSAVARDHSARLLVEKVRQIAGKYPVICTGDFNSTQATAAFATLATGILMDTHAIAAHIENDTYRTSHGYKVIAPVPDAGRIDHIFISRAFPLEEIKLWKVCVENFGGHWASDHYPVYIDLDLN